MPLNCHDKNSFSINRVKKYGKKQEQATINEIDNLKLILIVENITYINNMNNSYVKLLTSQNTTSEVYANQ